jgi:hypothetical protein
MPSASRGLDLPRNRAQVNREKNREQKQHPCGSQAHAGILWYTFLARYTGRIPLGHGGRSTAENTAMNICARPRPNRTPA